MKSREQQLRDAKVDEKKWETAFDLLNAMIALETLLRFKPLFSDLELTAQISQAEDYVRYCRKKYNRYARI